MSRAMLTTIDNPFDPFTEFNEWHAYDLELARKMQRNDTCSYLALIVKTSDELSQQDEDIAVESAIDEIVAQNVLGIYKKVVVDDKEDS